MHKYEIDRGKLEIKKAEGRGGAKVRKRKIMKRFFPRTQASKGGGLGRAG